VSYKGKHHIKALAKGKRSVFILLYVIEIFV
jgi:hypothetical protein